MAASLQSTRRVVLLGSSGGGAATLGGGDAETLRAALATQLSGIQGGCVISEAIFVACDETALDSAAGTARASLWTLQGDRLRCHLEGPLEKVNTQALLLDAELASRMEAVDGVIAISTDVGPGGVNRRTMAAAGQAKIPVAGTGGTSLSLAASDLGCCLAGNAGGSVATTPETKALGIAAGLASAWGATFAPPTSRRSFAWHSALDGCLPAFLAASCLNQALPSSAPAELRLALQVQVLPPVLGAAAAQQGSGLGELALLGGALLGSLCRGSCAAALLGGRIFASLAPRCLVLCARLSIPATATALSVAGGLSTMLGTLAFVMAPQAAEATEVLRRSLRTSLSYGPPGLAGAFAGVLMNFGSRRGWYHQFFLPLILVEMEHASMSFLGALDWLTLCMTGAGACAAQWLLPRRQEEKKEADTRLAKRGVALNLFFGDYIEACFPFLARDFALDASVYIASGLAGAIIATGGGAQSTAYLAAPLAIAVGTERPALAKAAAVAFGLPLAAGLASNALRRSREK
ncbi:unnamed protein product, partial [Symbiodinium sp. CCMP2456]